MKFLKVLSLSVVLMTTLPVSSALAESPGLTFSEHLGGAVYPDGDFTKSMGADFTIVIDDLAAWRADPRHQGRLSGTIDLDGQRFEVRGTIDIGAPAPCGYELRYRFATVSGMAHGFSFDGAKRICNEPGNDDVIAAATVLTGDLTDETGDPSYTKLVFNWQDWTGTSTPFIRSFKAIRVVGGQAVDAGHAALVSELPSFLGVWLGALGEQYLPRF